MALEHPHIMTVEDYFHLDETDTEHRYEYLDGQVYMMAGGHLTTVQLAATFTAFCEASFVGNRAEFTIQTSKCKFLKNATSIPMLPSPAIHATEEQVTFSNLQG